jgi:DNA helicase II / ATP-dependent DNA helicase PcrA
MPLEISDSDIGYAEDVLFGRKGVFDCERIAFIKNLDTIDLQAVPGSGKTTALLAKLLIIEKNLPFMNGSGVLVISHTNAAVNEIIDRIGKHCPKLFAYPNFVGTIQSFVDRYLAIPFAHNFLGVGLKWIDTDRYQDLLWKKFQAGCWSEFKESRKYLWGRHVTKRFEETKNDQAEAKQLCKQKIEKDVRDLFFDFTDSKVKKFDGKKVLLQDDKKKSYQELKTLVHEIIGKEVISYEYAYNMAEAFIHKAPIIKRLIRLRFKFIFVDEMQDMEKHQHDLLEDLFFCENVVYQRIGDKNQAIYSTKVSLEEIWIDRKCRLSLQGSPRLSPNVAQVVNNFALDNTFQIEGKGQSDISPYMIVFSNDVIKQVIPTFTQLVKNKIPSQTINDSKHPIKCIGWRREIEGNNLGIKDFYGAFETKASSMKTYYPNLKSHLVSWRISHPQKHLLNAARKSILEAIITVMIKEEIVQANGKHFITSSLFKYLRDTNQEFYDNFKLKIFIWSRDLYKENLASVFMAIKDYLPNLLALFGKEIGKSLAFINDDSPVQANNQVSASAPKNDNVYRCPETGIEVKVGTVHSAKGETHLATLYLETFYNKKYESDRLPHCFCDQGNEFSSDYDKQTAKVAYVAMSRPTHLLCFAIHKDRYVAMKDNIRGWEVIDLTL